MIFALDRVALWQHYFRFSSATLCESNIRVQFVTFDLLDGLTREEMNQSILICFVTYVNCICLCDYVTHGVPNGHSVGRARYFKCPKFTIL